jgi:hypothetical protein
MAHEPPVRQGDYRVARIAAAAAFTAVLVVLLLVDAASPDYAVEAVIVTLLVGTVLALFGVEVTDVLRGGRR